MPTTRTHRNRLHEIRQCNNSECRFRYPTLADDPRGWNCPHCQGTTAVAATVAALDEPAHRSQTRPPQSSYLAVMLDNIRSVYNVGSIFRTADGSGIRHLYLCGITPTPKHPKLTKTSLGAERQISWSYHLNAVDLGTQMRAAGASILALEGTSSATSIFDHPPIVGPTVLVIGNEQIGIDPGVLAISNACLAIPMRGIKRSLNVATAFGIAAYCLTDECVPQSE